MKPGDRVHYFPTAAIRPRVATLYKEEYGEALIGIQGVSGVMTLKVPTYQLSPIPVESNPDPSKPYVVSAFVVLHEGKRLGWKVLRGQHEPPLLPLRYYGEGPERPPYQECVIRPQYFVETEAWECARKWCASFSAHPAEIGLTPAESEEEIKKEQNHESD